MNLANAWLDLQQESSTQSGLFVRRIETTAPCGLLAGLEQPGSVRILLIEVPADAVGGEVWPRARGFHVRPVWLSAGGRNAVQLQLRCGDRAWSDVFSALTIDLVQRLSAAPSAAASVAALHQRLAIWQSFFQRQAQDGLTPEEQRGLFGELICLQRFLVDAWSPSEAVRAWQGPLGAAQDFVSRLSVEVKASLVDAPPCVRISSANQLQPPPGLDLLLCHIRLALLDAGDHSLPDLVAQVTEGLASLDASCLTMFLDRLQAAGYLHEEAEKYPNRYSVSEQRFYVVREGFPRIVPNDLKQGVNSVHYAIDLLALLPFRLDEPEALKLLRGA